MPSKVWSKLECFSTAFQVISSFSAEDFTVTQCVFPCRALKTPLATDPMPTLTSTSTTFTDIVPLSDGFFFSLFFCGLHPSWHSSSQQAWNLSNDKVRSEFSSAKREVVPELPLLSVKVAAVGVIELELELAAVPVELTTRDSSSRTAASISLLRNDAILAAKPGKA